MRHLLAATALLAASMLTPAQADIIIDTNGLGGTGDNVIFTSVTGGVALGRLNGQHDEVVRFTDRSLFNPDGGTLLGTFSAAANGNDIKIVNTTELEAQVFDPQNVNLVTTTREIFSLKGSGSVFIRVTALEADGSFQTFLFGSLSDPDYQLSASAQQGFDLSAINGERIYDLDIRVVGGTITDFEHYRIEVGPTVAAVPGPIAGAGLPGVAAGVIALVGLVRARRRRNAA